MWNSHAPAGIPPESKWSITWLKVFKVCPLEFQWGNYLECEKSKERRWKRSHLIICRRLCLWGRKLIARWQNRTWIDFVGSFGRFEYWTCWSLLMKGCFHLDYFRPSNLLISEAEEHAGLDGGVFPCYAWKTFTQTTCSGTDAKWACLSNFRYFHRFYDQSLLWFVVFPR